MKKTSACLALCAAILFISPASADETQDLKDFETALAGDNHTAAAAAYGRIFEARLPKDGKPKVDATLDALAGRLALLTGDVIYAQAFLQQPAGGDISDAPARALATAEALLISGNYDAARAASARAVQSLTGDARVQAMIGQAQAMIMTRPSDAAALIKTISSSNPALAWRISFLEAQSALLAKDYLNAQKAADRAMLQANAAPLRDYAPLQTLQLQAGVAAAQGLRDRMVALLAGVPSSSGTSIKISNEIANRLPACGTEGIRDDDYVIIGMVTQSTPAVAIPSPLAASRPEIVAPFMRSIAGYWRNGGGIQIATFPIMTVRCSGSDAQSFYNDGASFADAAFVATNHIRPRFLNYQYYNSDDLLADATKAFERIEKNVGAQSPVLITPLSELSSIENYNSSKNSDNKNINNSNSEQLYQRSNEIYKSIGGITIFYELSKEKSDYSKYYLKLRSILNNLAIEYAYQNALRALDSDSTVPIEKLLIAEIMLKRLGSDRRDRRVATMISRKAILLRAVDRGGEVETFAGAIKLDPSLCPAKAILPVVRDGGVTNNDYPSDAIRGEISGGTVIEVDIDALGKIVRQRRLVEAPALVFVPALDSTMRAMAFDPARDGQGRATACRAFKSRIRWQLPAAEDGPSSIGNTQPEL
ncbi:MAG: hypothetical protein AABY88_02750 [Pseudomonadota bacterium]